MLSLIQIVLPIDYKLILLFYSQQIGIERFKSRLSLWKNQAMLLNLEILDDWESYYLIMLNIMYGIHCPIQYVSNFTIMVNV